MTYVIGDLTQLEAFTDAVNAAEGLPAPPDSWPPGFDPQLDWVPTEEQPDPPPGWTARYYSDPVELADGRFAIAGVEEQHLVHATDAGLELAETVEIKPDLESFSLELNGSLRELVAKLYDHHGGNVGAARHALAVLIDLVDGP